MENRRPMLRRRPDTVPVRTPETTGPSLLEKIRNHPLTPPTAMVMALAGQISLYVPHSFDRNAHGGDTAADEILDPKNAQDLLRNGDLSNYAIIVGENEITVTVPPDQTTGENPEYTELRIPGMTTVDTFEVPMEWIGRWYQKNPELTDGADPVDAAITANVDQTLAEFGALGVEPDSVISAVSIQVDGFASPEGDSTNNLTASEKRAEHVADVTEEAYAGSGIAEEKIQVFAQGHGEEGDVIDFVRAVEAQGVSVKGADDTAKAKQVTDLIKACNDGREKRLEVIAAFDATIAAHRRATVTVTTDRVDVVLRAPAKAKDIVSMLEHYAPPQATSHTEKTPPPVGPGLGPVPPPLPPPPPPPPPLRSHSMRLVDAPKTIAPTVSRNIFPRELVRTVGTSTGTSIPRAHHTSKGFERSTGRNIQNPKRSSDKKGGQRNGSR